MSAGTNSVARRQALLAALIRDPQVEAKLHADPEALAREYEVSPEFARRLVQLRPARVAAFRRSCEHKQAVRRGRKPTRASGD